MTTAVISRAADGRACKFSVSRLQSGEFLCCVQRYLKYRKSQQERKI